MRTSWLLRLRRQWMNKFKDHLQFILVGHSLTRSPAYFGAYRLSNHPVNKSASSSIFSLMLFLKKIEINARLFTNDVDCFNYFHKLAVFWRNITWMIPHPRTTLSAPFYLPPFMKGSGVISEYPKLQPPIVLLTNRGSTEVVNLMEILEK